MPLVLTAIDLKLSPSASEMDRRRRRLDSLGEIVRHSGRVYDVTDFVTAGTNHILRLAYMTSQHLFLRWDQDQQGQISGNRGSSPPQQSSSTGKELVESSSAGRANTWHEAFLKFPRAYLLISTSVDYSLAVGRLPYDNALPELVRSIPPIGMSIRLPWTIDNPPVQIPTSRRLTRADSLPYIQTAATPVSATTEQTNHDVHTLPDDASVQTNLAQQQSDFSIPPQATSTMPLPDPSETENAIPELETGDNDQINLDYLYIEPESAEGEQAEFDRMQFQQLAQGFDPLISSWVQEYFGEGLSPPQQQQQQSPNMELDGLSLS